MTLSFRNIDVRVEDPVSTWPQEGLLTALERGSLRDWRRIASEIRRQPWGRVARAVEEILTYSQPYGVAPLMERVISTARKQASIHEAAEVACRIRDLRDRPGLSTAEFARGDRDLPRRGCRPI